MFTKLFVLRKVSNLRTIVKINYTQHKIMQNSTNTINKKRGDNGPLGQSSKKAKIPGDKPVTTSKAKSGVCFAFQKNNCTRGDQCRFEHILENPQSAPLSVVSAPLSNVSAPSATNSEKKKRMLRRETTIGSHFLVLLH